MPALYFNKDNEELRDAFNECVTKLKESGKLAEILTKWGFDPNSITPPAPGEPKG
jgi:ABC-type amino acid transport substrate-binding protein